MGKRGVEKPAVRGEYPLNRVVGGEEKAMVKAIEEVINPNEVAGDVIADGDEARVKPPIPEGD